MGRRNTFICYRSVLVSTLLTLTFWLEVTGKSIDFYVLLPDEIGVKYTEADIVLNEPFKMICRYNDPDVKNTCDQLWIYGESSNPLVRMFNDGTGSITDNFAKAARGHMNATFELVKTGMRIELDVYQASQKVFSHPAYSCRCVNWHEVVRTVQLVIHAQTAPKDLVMAQRPSPPYLEGQKVTLSCKAEAWPSKTQFAILANQKQVFCEKQVAKSREGVECEIEIQYALHQEVSCHVTNKMGSSSKPYDMVIYAKPALSMLRYPVNDIWEGEETTIECHSLRDGTIAQSLKLLRDGQPVAEVTQEPFDITYSAIFTRKSSGNYECVLTPEHYDVLKQSRVIDVLYGPSISVEESAMQVELSHYYTVSCYVEGSPKMMTEFQEFCSWKGISELYVHYQELSSDRLLISATLLSEQSMLSQEVIYECNCDDRWTSDPKGVNIHTFRTPTVDYISTLTNGCHNLESFTLECFGHHFPKKVKFSLLMNNRTLFETTASFITYTHQAFEGEEESDLNFECRAEFDSAGIAKVAQKSISFPKCDLKILGLEDSYKLDLSNISDKVDFEVLIGSSGYFTKYSVLWDLADSPISAFTEKISSSQLRSSISLEVKQFFKLKDPKLLCQVTADGLGDVNRSMTIVTFLKAQYSNNYDVQSKLGQEATLRWAFSMFPLPEDNKIVLMKDDVIIKHGLPPYKAILTRLNETRASFSIVVPVRSANDYGIYKLTVENSAGFSSQEVLLNHTVRPLLPLSIEFQPVSPEEALLVWHIGPETYGGIPEYFEIKFWDLKSMDPYPIEYKVDAVSEQLDYAQRMKKLKALGSYQSQLRSCNGNGLCSPWSPQLALNLSDPKFFIAQQSGGETAEASAVLVAFFVVIGVCTLLLVAAAIFIAKRKHNERKSRKERIAARNADGYATIPSRTVMRIPPPSPSAGRQFNTLDWSNTYRPVLEFQNFHPATLPKDFSDAGIQTQQDPDLLEHISKLGNEQPVKAAKHRAKNDSFVTFNGDEDPTPPLAMEDEELGDMGVLGGIGSMSHPSSHPSIGGGMGLYLNQRSQPPPLPQRIARTGNI